MKQTSRILFTCDHSMVLVTKGHFTILQMGRRWEDRYNFSEAQELASYTVANREMMGACECLVARCRLWMLKPAPVSNDRALAAQ